jgi:hypothetical protein
MVKVKNEEPTSAQQCQIQFFLPILFTYLFMKAKFKKIQDFSSLLL